MQSHSTIQNAEEISDSKCLTIHGTHIPTFPRSQSSGNIVEDSTERMGRGTIQYCLLDIFLDVAHINPKHLWLPAQDIYW